MSPGAMSCFASDDIPELHELHRTNLADPIPKVLRWADLQQPRRRLFVVSLAEMRERRRQIELGLLGRCLARPTSRLMQWAMQSERARCWSLKPVLLLPPSWHPPWHRL